MQAHTRTRTVREFLLFILLIAMPVLYVTAQP
jgi:hypothetical protein